MNLFRLKEDDIRPKLDLTYNREILYYKDLSIFFEKYKQNFQYVDCVSCKSKNHYKILHKDGFIFRKCNECETVFISPRPDPKALQWWYSNSENVKDYTEILEKTANKRMQIYHYRIDQLFKRLPPHSIKSLLEIGCGTGVFLKLLKAIKPELEITGIDINDESVDLTKEKGVNCLNVSAEEFAEKSTDQYDLILAFEIFEHIFDPFFLVKSLFQLLNKSGKIYMTTPNYLSYDFLQVGSIYKNIVGPSHLNYYNPFSIMKLLEWGGFSNIEIFCDGILDTDIVGNYHSDKKRVLDGFWGYIYDNREKHSKFLIDFQKLLQKYKLSGNMTVVGTKP